MSGESFGKGICKESRGGHLWPPQPLRGGRQGREKWGRGILVKFRAPLRSKYWVSHTLVKTTTFFASLRLSQSH